MHPNETAILAETRRQFFARTAKGIGVIALANLLAENGLAIPQSGESFGGCPTCPTLRPR